MAEHILGRRWSPSRWWTTRKATETSARALSVIYAIAMPASKGVSVVVGDVPINTFQESKCMRMVPAIRTRFKTRNSFYP